MYTGGYFDDRVCKDVKPIPIKPLEHNILFKEIGTKAYTLPKYRDTPLVGKGNFESLGLGKTWGKKEDIDIIFVSPLTRTIQTAANIFKNTNITNDIIGA